MDRMWNFAKRHRTKFAIAGVVGAIGAGGLYLVHRLAESKLKEWKDKEAKEVMEKLRQQQHFEATWRTGTLTFKGSVIPALYEALANAIATENIVATLKTCQNMEEKLTLWQKLKEMAFAKCVSIIICTSYLEVLLRCQLSIMSGHSYRLTTSKSKVPNDQNANHRSPKDLSSKVQEAYLSLCQIFIQKSVPAVCALLEQTVQTVVGDVPLNMGFTLGNMEMQLNNLVSSCNELANTELKKLFQADALHISSLDETEKEVLDVLFGETLEILECEELTGQALHSSTVLALNAVVDKIAEKCFQTTDSNSSFIHPDTKEVPLAKLVPFLCNLITLESRDQDYDWMLVATSSEKIKTFSANIYQSFSVHVESYQ